MGSVNKKLLTERVRSVFSQLFGLPRTDKNQALSLWDAALISSAPDAVVPHFCGRLLIGISSDKTTLSLWFHIPPFAENIRSPYMAPTA